VVQGPLQGQVPRHPPPAIVLQQYDWSAKVVTAVVDQFWNCAQPAGQLEALKRQIGFANVAS